MKIFFGPSKSPHITENDTGIWRRFCGARGCNKSVFNAEPENEEEKCWETGNYTGMSDCELCSHKYECSGYNDKEE